MSDPRRVSVYTIPSHRSFADALAAGLIARFGKDPLGLARGRILLPNNRAVRAVTDAFVRASGSGLLLPRLIPVGDPEIDERIGGALDPHQRAKPARRCDRKSGDRPALRRRLDEKPQRLAARRYNGAIGRRSEERRVGKD